MNAYDYLSRISPNERTRQPEALFSRLVDFAGEAKRSAGTLNREVLVNRLISEGFRLNEPSDCRRDLQKLDEHANLIMNGIRSDIGGVELSRVDVVLKAQESLLGTPLLEIVGPPGTGKSAVLKFLAIRLRGEGPVMVLSGDRLSGTG